MIILYMMQSTSPNIRKITMMLNETGLPYAVHKFEKMLDGKLPEEFLAINPNGTVPAILDKKMVRFYLNPVQFCITWQKSPASYFLLRSKPGVR